MFLLFSCVCSSSSYFLCGGSNLRHFVVVVVVAGAMISNMLRLKSEQEIDHLLKGRMCMEVCLHLIYLDRV